MPLELDPVYQVTSAETVLLLGLARPEDRFTQRASLTLLACAGYQLYESLTRVFVFVTFSGMPRLCLPLSGLSAAIRAGLQFVLPLAARPRRTRGPRVSPVGITEENREKPSVWGHRYLFPPVIVYANRA